MHLSDLWSKYTPNHDNNSSCFLIFQLDEDKASQLANWVPRKLAPQVRCVFSMINDTPQHKNLMERESKAQELVVTPLSLLIRKVNCGVVVRC